MKTKLNPNAITKRNVERFCGRWGKTIEQLQYRFNVKVSGRGYIDERLESRLNLVLSSLTRKNKVGTDGKLLYATVNRDYEPDELIADGVTPTV